MTDCKLIDSYKIIEAAKDARHPGDVAYFVVEFYDAGKLVLTEDFQMPHLKTTASQPVTNASGDFVLMDGSTLTKASLESSLEWARTEFASQFQKVKDGGQWPEITDGMTPKQVRDIVLARENIVQAINAAIAADNRSKPAQSFSMVQRQSVNLDVATQIRDNIERYMQTAGAKGISGDRRDKTIRPVDKVAAGITQRPEVQALKVASVDPMKKPGVL